MPKVFFFVNSKMTLNRYLYLPGYHLCMQWQRHWWDNKQNILLVLIFFNSAVHHQLFLKSCQTTPTDCEVASFRNTARLDLALHVRVCENTHWSMSRRSFSAIILKIVITTILEYSHTEWDRVHKHRRNTVTIHISVTLLLHRWFIYLCHTHIHQWRTYCTPTEMMTQTRKRCCTCRLCRINHLFGSITFYNHTLLSNIQQVFRYFHTQYSQR